MFTFEVLQGDVFDIEGELLAVTQLRVNPVGEQVRVYVRYVFKNEVKNRPADEFVAWIREGLQNGLVKSINRPADFGLF